MNQLKTFAAAWMLCAAGAGTAIAGDVVGTVELKLAGETIGVVELIAGQDVARNPLLFGVDKVKEFFTSLYLKVVLVLSLIAALIYGLWLLCANWNRRKPTKKIHRRY